MRILMQVKILDDKNVVVPGSISVRSMALPATLNQEIVHSMSTLIFEGAAQAMESVEKTTVLVVGHVTSEMKKARS